jgi:hypothetical protein
MKRNPDRLAASTVEIEVREFVSGHDRSPESGGYFITIMFGKITPLMSLNNARLDSRVRYIAETLPAEKLVSISRNHPIQVILHAPRQQLEYSKDLPGAAEFVADANDGVQRCVGMAFCDVQPGQGILRIHAVVPKERGSKHGLRRHDAKLLLVVVSRYPRSSFGTQPAISVHYGEVVWRIEWRDRRIVEK